MNISIDKLRYFHEVAQLEHVNKAAKNLNISPSVVSESIKQIEKELDVILFDRVKRKLYLTREGEKVLHKTKTIITHIESLYHDFSTEIVGEFKLGISLSLFKDPLFDVKRLHKLVQNNSRLKVNINTSDTGRLVELVINGSLDAAIVYSPIKHESIIEKVIEETSFHIALKNNHKIFNLSKKEQVTYLNSLPAIGFNASVGDNMCQNHPIFDKFGIIPDYKYFYDVDEVAVELVNKTNGWIFTARNIIDKNKSIKALNLGQDWDVPMNISLIRNRNRPKSAVISELF